MVTIFGLGFVGLTTGVGLAEKGCKVYGFDINEDRLGTLRQGKLPFLEPGLDEALMRNLNHNFFLDVPLEKAIADSEYIFYCVGTPYGKGGHADLSYLFKAIDDTLEMINDQKFRLLIIKSTIPPSTTAQRIVPYVQAKAKDQNLSVANNPEFLREGSCWNDFMDPDRIIFGVNDLKSKEMLERLYMPFNSPMYAVSYNTGEFIKYLSNTVLATLISYSNEMSIVADEIGDIDTALAFRIVHQDKRWNSGKVSTYLYPGCGYGGYCLPKDVNALFSIVKERGVYLPILDHVIKTNDLMPEIIYNRIKKTVDKNAAIGILGLSFKPGSDDVRDTPSAKIISVLLKNGYTDIYAYDPVANHEFERHYPDLKVTFCEKGYDIINIADVFVITTAWEEFKQLSLSLKDEGKYIIDCRFML